MSGDKIKLNKSELKRQKDMLKQREEFLPVLELKKQQLQIVVDSLNPLIENKINEVRKAINDISRWYKFFSEDTGFNLEKLFDIEKVETDTENIAGVDTPNFEKVLFNKYDYDLFLTPAWVDKAREKLRHITSLREEVNLLINKRDLLAEELRQTTIRVNLFEKILIPQHKENIKKIKIYLGDQEVAQISIAKIAKAKLEEAQRED